MSFGSWYFLIQEFQFIQKMTSSVSSSRQNICYFIIVTFEGQMQLCLVISHSLECQTIPSSFENLSNLDSLYLFSNLFNGTIPSFLFTLLSLGYLDLHNNHFISNISEFQHHSFEYLDLSNNHLHGSIPSLIFKQEYLEVLILASNNKLTGEISYSICILRIFLYFGHQNFL